MVRVQNIKTLEIYFFFKKYLYTVFVTPIFLQDTYVRLLEFWPEII